jgi:hypothetical protein
MYLLPPMSENPTPFFGALSVYYGDIVYYEPRLLELYDEIPSADRSGPWRVAGRTAALKRLPCRTHSVAHH